jgi:hypothetical protein
MSNLDIINDWMNGNNLRPASITFAQDDELNDIQAKKAACEVGECYEDHEGKTWKRLGANSWAHQPKILTALKETNPNCRCCDREIEYDDRYNVTAYQKSKMCFDCMIEIDTQRKITGKFKEYEALRVLQNQQGWVKDKLEELHEYFKVSDKDIEFVNEFGDLEKWKGDKDKLKADLIRDIDEGEAVLLKITTELEALEADELRDVSELIRLVKEKQKRQNERQDA